MNLTNQSAYQARHPKSVLVTPEFPHCAAALNALFANDAWKCDEDINVMLDDEVDLSTDEALKNFRAGPAVWRAPTETLRGPCSLWKEIQEVKSPPPANPSEIQSKSYTTYKLVCEVDRFIYGDLQSITHIADRHNCSFGIEAMGDKVLIQLAFVR